MRALATVDDVTISDFMSTNYMGLKRTNKRIKEKGEGINYIINLYK